MKKILLVVLNLLLCINGKSQNIEFVENKGQWNSKATFGVNINNGNFFLEQSGYKVVLNNAGDIAAIAGYFSGHHIKSDQLKENSPGEKLMLHSHAYEVKFKGASLEHEIIPEDASETYNNYCIGNDPSKWAFHCNIYNAATFKNIYPNIDVRYYSRNNQFTYDFIVHPGGDVNNIALLFDGVDGLGVNNEDLIIKTSLGNVSELRPYTYQENKSGAVPVQSKYIVSGNMVQFKIDNYDKNSTLIIDPTLVFSTFSGSEVDNWGYCTTYDAQGNFYMGSIAFGTGFPVSNGAYQTVFGGGNSGGGGLSGYDIAILKLNANGTNRLYGTYLGGGGNEEPHNLKVDNNGNLIVTGITNSSNFPTTQPNYGPWGGNDIFISKFSLDGTILIASRKICGTEDDGVNIRSKEIVGPISITRNYSDDSRSELVLDDDNNIYFASCTQSQNFPVTQNSFQTAFGGKQDGVLIKLNADLSSVLFSSFIGGSGDDAAFSLALNPLNKNIYVVGSTTSNNLKGTGGNTGPILFNSFKGGVCDGFISVISNDGSSQIKTCYIGTNGNDMLYEIQIDNNGSPFIMGTTTVSFPVINAAFNSQANGKQFITKLKSNLSDVVYSTNFGKGQAVPDIAPTAFEVDNCGNVYVAGWGGGINTGENYPNATTSGLSVTADAIRPTTDGSDFYIFVLEKNAHSQLYGTFYGNIDNVPDVGDHTDGGNSRFDKEGNLYLGICANCNKIGTFPTTPNVWSPANQAETGAKCNMAAVKITFNFSADCVLPVTLLSFNGAYSNHQTLLQWKTAQEINSSYFIIEHSITGQNFVSIGTVNAAGNSSNVASYNFSDDNPAAGLHYYRLKMVDKDGAFKYSGTVMVVVNKQGRNIYVYPNPASTEITLVCTSLAQATQVSVVNNLGAVVKKIKLSAGATKTQINIQSLSSGWYSLRLMSNNKIETINFLKE